MNNAFVMFKLHIGTSETHITKESSRIDLKKKSLKKLRKMQANMHRKAV